MRLLVPKTRRFAGHGFITGKEKNAWQSVNEVLTLFVRKKRVARDEGPEKKLNPNGDRTPRTLPGG